MRAEDDEEEEEEEDVGEKSSSGGTGVKKREEAGEIRRYNVDTKLAAPGYGKPGKQQWLCVGARLWYRK
ncbi:hypothetical protein GX48_05606 [Paracoccidioides brasiliensis]|nr:hypothetical protein GX48_05606 [Paracoccidioides brasiliensis]